MARRTIATSKIGLFAKRAVAEQVGKAKRRFLKVKMRTSLHGRPILIPKTMASSRAAGILMSELKRETPIKTGKARGGWRQQRLVRGDWRLVNFVAYIRRLMLDGYSKQSAPGAVHRAIARARGRMQQEVTTVIKQGKPGKAKKKVSQKVSDEFVPAKTVKEAELFAENTGIVKNANYQGLSLEQSNILNRELLKVKSKNSAKFKEIKIDNALGFAEGEVTGSRLESVMRINIDRVNKSFNIRDSSSLSGQLIKRKENILELIEDAKKLGFDEDLPGLRKRLKIINKEISDSPKFWSVAESRITANERLSTVFQHEHAHIIQGNEGVLISDNARLKISNYFSSLKNEDFKNFYTEYAKTEWTEFWAEAHSLNERGLLRDIKMKKLLDEIKGEIN